jgi:tyrosyl-tRNA synthetase
MTLQDDLQFRGLVHQVTDEGLLDQLAAGGVVVYAGFDPTAPSLHLGHLLPLCNLRRLQLAGNQPIALAGGGTGLIGDPSFKDTERPLLTQELLDANVAGIRPQLEKFLDFSSSAGSTTALLLDNSAWLTTISLTDFLRDVGKHFTVNQMIAKESVKSRLDRSDVGLSFTEFSYSLLQGYDFLRLHLDHGCTTQVGGSDQWGNIVTGTELIRKVTSHTAFGLTSPLLLRGDGKKFGKTEGGQDNVWLDPAMTSPFQMHQFLRNADDQITPMMLRYFTFLSHEEIRALDAETANAPQRRAAQRALADEVVTMVHGAAAAQAATRAGEALFSEAISTLDEATLLDVMADAPTTKIPADDVRDGLSPVALLVRTGLASSNGEARRFVSQGGVYVNNVRASDDGLVTREHALHGKYLVVRRGPRATHLVVLS